MKRWLLAATILAAATSPGWAATALHVTGPDASGTDPVMLNEGTSFDVVDNSGASIGSPLTVYLVDPVGTAAPTVSSALFNGVTSDSFTLSSAALWTPGVGGESNSLYAFEGCKGCDASINLANIQGVNVGATQFDVYTLSVNTALGAKNVFEDINGLFAKGTVIAPFGMNGGKVFDTSWTNAGFVDATVGAVPEASTWAMLFAGFALLGGVAWRKQKRARLAI